MSDSQEKNPITIGQVAIDAVPTFDVGFQVPAANQLEHALGQAAINTEKIYESLGNQIDNHLNQAYTNTSLAQTTLSSALYDNMQQAQTNTTILQNALESSLAGQMGLPLEVTQTIAPSNPAMQQIMQAGMPQPGPAIQIKPGGGKGAIMVSPVGLSLDPANPTQMPYDICGALLAMGKEGAGQYVGKSVLAGYYREISTPCPPGAPPGCGGGGTGKVIIEPALDDSGRSTYRVTMMGDQMGHGSWGYCQPFPDDSSTGGTGTGYTTNCPPPICPPCPPPPKCDTIFKWPECIKICDVTPKKCEEPVYQVYCNPDTGMFVVVLRSDTSNTTPGKLIAEGTAKEIDWRGVCGTCQPIDSGEPEEPVGNDPVFAQQMGCGGLFTFPQLQDPNNLTTFYDMLADVVNTMKERNKEMNGSGWGYDIINWVWDIIGGGGKIADDLLQMAGSVLSGGNCAADGQGELSISLALFGLLNKFIGPAADPNIVQTEYARNYLCPYILPTAEEATRQYLTDSIDIDRLECIVKANGRLWEPHKAMIDSARSRLNPAEVLMYWRRNKMTDQRASDYLRELGYLEADDRQALADLTQAIPAVSDIMSMMIRDVEDNINIDWTDSDKIFTQKWKGQLKEWGDNQGIPEVMAKYIWRAHWSIPSPTQLFEFWKRLRKSGQFGTEKEFHEKIKQALIQQDILPEWVDPFLEVSFHPLTRVDAKRAFSIGALDEEGLKDAFTQQGYDDNNVDTMVSFTKKQLRVQTGKNPLIKRYATGEIGLEILKDMLNEQGLNEEMIQFAVEVAQRELQITQTKFCVQAIRKRYLLGELSFNEVAPLLTEQELDADQVVALSRSWQCQKTSRGKTVPAATLCGWYERGAIDEISLYKRLVNLGYDNEDAAGMTQDCMVRSGVKLNKAQQDALNKASREAMASAKQAAKTQAQLQAAAQKDQDSRDKAQKTKEQKQRKILQIGEAFAAKTGGKFGETTMGIQQIINGIMSNTFASYATAVNAVEFAAKHPEVTTLLALNQTAREAVADLVG